MTSLYTYFCFLRTGRDRNYTTDLNMTSSYVYFSFPRTGWDRNYTTDLNTTSLYTYFQPKQNSKTQKYTKKFEHNKPLHVLPPNIQKKTLFSNNSHNHHQFRSYSQEAIRLPSLLPMSYSVNNIIYPSTNCSA